MLRFRVLASLASLASVGCYAPDVRDCAFQCGANDACPAELACVDGMCRTADPVGSCADVVDPDGATGDCDPTAEFAKIEPVAGLALPMIDETAARLNANELRAYVAAAPDTVTASQLFVGVRATLTDAFVLTEIAEANSAESDTAPTVTPLETGMVFASARLAGQGTHLYVAGRAAATFDEPVLASVNSSLVTDFDVDPFLSDDDLWFASTRAGVVNHLDVYLAPRVGLVFGAPSAVATVNAADGDTRNPVVSADGLTIYVASNRVSSDGLDIWRAHRSTSKGVFGELTKVAELNTGSTEYPSSISRDNCRLYFVTSRNNKSLDVFVASRR